MTLTRRDRLAMDLAYHWLKAQWSNHARWVQDAAFGVDMAVDVLNTGGQVCDDVSDALPRWRSQREGYTVPYRHLRARLALALRALLRADAGDYATQKQRAKYVCECGLSEWESEYDLFVCAGCGRYEPSEKTVPPPFTPLWQQAPATGTAVRAAGLRRR